MKNCGRTAGARFHVAPQFSAGGAWTRRLVKSSRSLLLAVGITAILAASERGVVALVCPLDDTSFEAVQDFSGYAEGQRLDLKPLGPVSQPPALARCPQCGFPLYTKHPTLTEIPRLRAIVAGERFRTEARPAAPWFALGVLREELAAEPFAIAWTYLQASWEAEEDSPASYARAAERSLAWFDRAAAALRDDPARSRDALVARYLGVELCRRLGRFDEARVRLERIAGAAHDALPWLARARAEQARRIAAQEAAPDDGRTDRPR